MRIYAMKLGERDRNQIFKNKEINIEVYHVYYIVRQYLDW